MKKATKIIAVVILCAIMCCTLCSCNSLDKMKATQAVFTDNNSKNEILYNNKMYKLLSPTLTTRVSCTTSTHVVNITESDVPVLLSPALRCEGYTDNEENIIECINDDEVNYYCREDLYDDIYESLKSGKLDHYAISQFDQNTMLYKIVVLDANSIQAINYVLDKVKSTEIDDVPYNSLSIVKCDKSGLFTDNYVSYDLYIAKELDGFYMYTDSYQDEIIRKKYKIPDKYSDVLGKLYDTYYQV